MSTVPPDTTGPASASNAEGVEEPSDAELITAVRSGDLEAFGLLYRRHLGAAQRLARQITRSAAEADDLVADAFSKMLDALRGGGGPDSAFRAYLLTTLRNTLYDNTRKNRLVEPCGDLTAVDPGEPFRDTAIEQLDAALVARAYATLPERWQTVLWHTEIEGESPAAVAPLLGLSPNAVSALAHRAREGLRQAYLQVHLTDTAVERCRHTVERLGAWARDGLSKRDTAAVQAHLSSCPRCSALAAELVDVNRGLLSVVAPMVVGAPWVAGYLSAGTAKGAAAGAATGAAAGAGAHATADGALAKGGPAAKLLKTPGGQAAVAAGVTVALAAVLVIALSGHHTPLPPQAAPSRPAQPPPASQPPVPKPSTPPSTATPPPPPASSPASPAPAVLNVGTVAALGQLAAGRDGVITLPVSNTGPMPARDLRADLVLSNGATVRSGGGAGGAGGGTEGVAPMSAPLPVPGSAAPSMPARPSPAVSRAVGSGWSCWPVASGGHCMLAALPAATSAPLYLRVGVPAGVTRLTVSGRFSATRRQPVTIAARTLPVDATPGSTLPVFADVARASVLAVGNTVLSCPTTGLDILDAACQQARHGIPAPSGASLACAAECNDDWPMTGYEPSRATLSLPAGGRVLWAGLFWSGVDPCVSPGRGTVWLGRPGRTPRAVPARTVHTVGDSYQAYADVTRAVTGGGVWQVTGVVADPGRGHYGGWSLVVVVGDDSLPVRQVTVLDGLQQVTGPPTTVDLPWLIAPHGTAQVSMVGWEGDRGVGGERITVDGQPIDRGDGLAGHADGAFYDRPGEAGVQTFGVDTLSAPVRLAGSMRSRLVARAGQDQYLVGPVAMVAPVS
jgi:RNA polymerase sigma factor (sigma-70 family)